MFWISDKSRNYKSRRIGAIFKTVEVIWRNSASIEASGRIYIK